MPYLPEGRKKEVGSEPKRANTDVDFNYLYTREYLREFIANPSYATIAKIQKAALRPRKIESVFHLDNLLTVLGVTADDREAARLLAYAEFYARIGRKYEDQSIAHNGDLVEYAEAERAIAKKFGLAI